MSLLQSDAQHLPLRDRSVQCVVTSPPYFGLRDYGLGPEQLGFEPTPDRYVQHLVEIFREVRRILRDDGTMWLNLGDCYSGSRKGPGGPKQRTNVGSIGLSPTTNLPGLKSKDLIGIPWRVALALQADGWYLRCDIIWAKRNPMPESARDRPTRSHEYVFLLSKNAQYHYDHMAIREPGSKKSAARYKYLAENGRMLKSGAYRDAYDGTADFGLLRRARNGNPKPPTDGKRNCRSVWFIPNQSYRGAHFATFPEKLVEPCILAGCPKGGIVLDPFCGSGTVVKVAEHLGRVGVGIDLKFKYLQLAQARVETEHRNG